MRVFKLAYQVKLLEYCIATNMPGKNIKVLGGEGVAAGGFNLVLHYDGI